MFRIITSIVLISALLFPVASNAMASDLEEILAGILVTAIVISEMNDDDDGCRHEDRNWRSP